MTNARHTRCGSLSRRLYALLLAAYPRGFRREYGREMLLVFADRCREQTRAGGRAALAAVWRDALFDLALSAPREHLDRITRGGGLMRTLRTVVLAALAYAFALLVAAPWYVRNKEWMPTFVATLIDGLISVGVVFNFIFLLLTLTGWVEPRRAVRITLVAAAVLITALIALMTLSLGPSAHVKLEIVVAHVLSIVFWFTIHAWWVLRKWRAEPPAPA